MALSPVTPMPGAARTPLSDEAIWKRLREAGFDEASIKRRDKAALISYIAKLEAELYEHQHHMGLLILEKKEWVSKFDQLQAAAESADLLYKREQAAHASDMAEAKKREDNLKKALGIEKECVANIEKTMHEMRAECAETKVMAESKLAEARGVMEEAQRKCEEAEVKLRSAESLEVEASRNRRAAERTLREVEAREDDLRIRLTSFKLDCDAKEKEIHLERQALSERQRIMQQSQERLLDGQALLNQREEYISIKLQELNTREKELEDSKLKIENEIKAFKAEKCSLELKATSLAAREESLIKRESDLKRKEEELLVLQGKLASKEFDVIQKVAADYEASLVAKTSSFEAELEMKRKQVEEEADVKRRDWELKEMDMKQREDLILEREHDLETQSRSLVEREKDLEEKLHSLAEKEKSLMSAEEELEVKRALLQKEKEEMNQVKLDLQKSLDSLEEKREEINRAEGKLECMKSETNELLVLEVRLKEEIDMIRAQKLELEAEADQLKAEKAKFETEWELIDEKREELRKEAERVAEEKSSFFKFLKDERDSLKAEKTAMQEEYKHGLESLSRDREAFMTEIERERSEWFSKIQKERADILLDLEMQKKELENQLDKRREEIENHLTEREEAFEEEKNRELQQIASLKESVAKEMEHIRLEMNRLDGGRREINVDREKRDQEWAELSNAIEELQVQRMKLEKQRELLRADRKEILAQIENLKKLEDIKDLPDRIVTPAKQQSDLQSSERKFSANGHLEQQIERNLDHTEELNNGVAKDMSFQKVSDAGPSPLSAPFSWLKRCADTLLEQTQSHKRRKKDKDASAQSGDTLLQRGLATILDRPEIEHATSFNQTTVGTEETTVYVDKIVTVQEITAIDVEKVMGGTQEGASSLSDEKLRNDGDRTLEENGNFRQDFKRMQDVTDLHC